MIAGSQPRCSACWRARATASFPRAPGPAGLELAQTAACDLVLTDIKLPGLSGLELLEKISAARPRLPVIVMTAHGTSEIAIEATKLGAYDYLLKPFEIPEMIALVSHALTSSRLAVEPVEIGNLEAKREALIGNSRAMREIYKEIGRVAAKPVTVLIRGESGTGKELVARALYQHSERADKPFIAINCAAIPETLLESELFGHERGAFTGAESRRIGRFEQAHGGTLFLDEIGDLSPSTQVKLLRVLQERSIQRLGGRETIPVDTRIIAATHRDLEREIAAENFRDDLFYRLNVASIQIPPLRERAEDIPELARFFLRRHGAELEVRAPAIEPAAVELLLLHRWPGNVRELQNVIRKALLAARGYPITREIISSILEGPVKREMSSSALTDFVAETLAAARAGALENAHSVVHEAIDRELVSQAIRLAGGNQAEAARWLGISRFTLRAKLRAFGLHPSQQDGDDDTPERPAEG